MLLRKVLCLAPRWELEPVTDVATPPRGSEEPDGLPFGVGGDEPAFLVLAVPHSLSSVRVGSIFMSLTGGEEGFLPLLVPDALVLTESL